MQPGRSLSFSDFLPFDMSTDDALIYGAALALFMIVWSLGHMFFDARDPFAARLKSIRARRAELKGAITAATRRKKPGAAGTMTMMRQIVQQLKLLQQYQIDQLQTKLIRAGFRFKDAIVIFAFAKLVMPFIGLGLGIFFSGINWSDPFTVGQATGWLILLGCGYFGARLPEIIVANAKSRRYHTIQKAIPDALDLMMICAEAGLSLAAALDRVARELERMSPVLAEEFSLTSVELGFLPDRAVALKHLAERVDIKEVRGMVNVIAQTEKYGTPIAQALRVITKEYRTERMLRAEQKAARLPALMTVPMIVFILPSLFVVVLAPAIIGVMDTLK